MIVFGTKWGRDLADALEHTHSWGEVLAILQQDSPRITHVEQITEELFVVWGHINCEWCRLCEPQGDMRGETSQERVVLWSREPLYPDQEAPSPIGLNHGSECPECEGGRIASLIPCETCGGRGHIR